jgi:peptidoglycan hydrolase-like protein with peptidoglycan-binding domain
MHPIVLLIIAGAGGYFLWDTLQEKEPEVQGLDTAGSKIVVPTTNKTPEEGVSDVPIPPGNGPQAIHKKHHHHKSANLHPDTPAIITPSGASNLSVQTIHDVQRAANTLGVAVPSIPVDGYLNPQTKRAISTLQHQLGIPPTGKPDMPTMNAIERALGQLAMGQSAVGAYPPVQQATVHTVKKLVKMATQLAVDDISGMQRALNAIGSKPTLAVDNVLGSKTIAAVKAFQISQGLVADGIPGPKTLTALQAAVDPGAMAAVAHNVSSIFTGESRDVEMELGRGFGGGGGELGSAFGGKSRKSKSTAHQKRM